MHWLAKLWDFRFSLACVCIPVAFALGRVTAPVPLAEIRTETVTKIEYKDRVVERKVAGETRVVYRDRTVYREGPVQERVVEREAARSEVAETRVAEHERNAMRSERAEIRPTHKEWRVGVLVGADLSPAWQPLPSGGVLTIGGTIQRRVAGGLWVGGFVLSTGVAGLSATVDF